MKTTLTFTSETPEDIDELRVTLDAVQWYFVAWDLDQELRDLIKYQGREELQEARDLLHRLIEGRGLSLDALA